MRENWEYSENRENGENMGNRICKEKGNIGKIETSMKLHDCEAIGI